MLSHYLPYENQRTCPSDGVRTGQMVAVVVRWIEQRPQRWHENFKVLALLALHEAWPCK